jgi:hypothetical protein
LDVRSFGVAFPLSLNVIEQREAHCVVGCATDGAEPRGISIPKLSPLPFSFLKSMRDGHRREPAHEPENHRHQRHHHFHSSPRRPWDAV